jgi:DNA-binding transcriptional ArsR family regulator
MMSEATERLERLIAAEVGECREGDLDERLHELDDLETEAELDRAETDVDVFATLGNETRYQLVRVLVASDDELCVCELDAIIEVGDSAVSHALRDLVDAGLVERRKEGKWRYYGATERAERLIDVVDETRP